MISVNPLGSGSATVERLEAQAANNPEYISPSTVTSELDSYSTPTSRRTTPPSPFRWSFGEWERDLNQKLNRHLTSLTFSERIWSGLVAVTPPTAFSAPNTPPSTLDSAAEDITPPSSLNPAAADFTPPSALNPAAAEFTPSILNPVGSALEPTLHISRCEHALLLLTPEQTPEELPSNKELRATLKAKTEQFDFIQSTIQSFEMCLCCLQTFGTRLQTIAGDFRTMVDAARPHLEQLGLRNAKEKTWWYEAELKVHIQKRFLACLYVHIGTAIIDFDLNGNPNLETAARSLLETNVEPLDLKAYIPRYSRGPNGRIFVQDYRKFLDVQWMQRQVWRGFQELDIEQELNDRVTAEVQRRKLVEEEHRAREAPWQVKHTGQETHWISPLGFTEIVPAMRRNSGVPGPEESEEVVGRMMAPTLRVDSQRIGES